MSRDSGGATQEQEQESDRLHRGVQKILRVGLGLSVALMAAGAGLRLARGLEDAPAVRLFDLVDSKADLGLTLTALGIFALALTPAFRVAALVYLWAKEKDVRFVIVALVVLATLGVSVALGKGG